MFIAIGVIPINDKKDELQLGRLFQREWLKYLLPISNTLEELAGMDFVDYGVAGGLLFCTYKIIFRCILRLPPLGRKKKICKPLRKRRRRCYRSGLLLGTSDIILADGNSGFIGSEFSRFRHEQNVTLQTVIEWAHQSLWAAERRHRYSKDIILQVKYKRG